MAAATVSQCTSKRLLLASQVCVDGTRSPRLSVTRQFNCDASQRDSSSASIRWSEPPLAGTPTGPSTPLVAATPARGGHPGSWRRSPLVAAIPARCGHPRSWRPSPLVAATPTRTGHTHECKHVVRGGHPRSCRSSPLMSPPTHAFQAHPGSVLDTTPFFFRYVCLAVAYRRGHVFMRVVRSTSFELLTALGCTGLRASRV